MTPDTTGTYIIGTTEEQQIRQQAPNEIEHTYTHIPGSAGKKPSGEKELRTKHI